jgi:predicted  nucleic acid-binding Zn-ribbon protein
MPIGPQRLILINSSVYDYAEVELAGTLQIVGPNNIGKTTLIKTLQFLYLNDRRHMDFGAHSPEQTREFYFPNQYSYILFECLGVTGQHVIGWRGQSKTSGGEPERFCYSGPFVPTDFHNEKNQVREPREVDAQLSLKNLRKIKTAEEHKELLLPPASGEARGLGIVALRDSEKFHQFRETLKNLLTLSTITQEQMRDCLLMLADIPPNRTAFDARELFGNDYDSILKHKEKLDKFRQNQTFVEKLVGKFTVRETARGELLWRWTDLRAKRHKFEKAHEETLAAIRESKITLEGKVTALEAEVADRRKDVAEFSEQKGQITGPLQSIETQDKEFKSFAEEFERAALANLKKEIRTLETQLANAEGESREKARQKFDLYTDLVRQKEKTIARFDHLAITALRKQFSDEELTSIFRVLNRELLELPVGKDGISIKRQGELLAMLRGLVKQTQDGVYRDANVSFALPKTGEPLAGLENLDTAREQLTEHQATLKRWKEILAAIEQREKLEGQLKSKREDAFGKTGKDGEILVEGKERKLFRFEEYQKAKAKEPQLRAELKKIEATITAANERTGKLELQLEKIKEDKRKAESAGVKEENEFNAVMGRFGDCIFPEFAAKERAVEGIPTDFDPAIALFLRQQKLQADLAIEVANDLRQTEQWFGDEYRGDDETESMEALRAEFEALAEKEEALTRNWNTLIEGLKATFDSVLKNMGHVASAASELNRAFAKVRVSNLKSVKLEVVEHSDLMSWIKKLAAFDPGGLFSRDPQKESAITNFRAYLQGKSVIRFADLFTLGVTVTRADGHNQTYHDLREIESHGTTISIKVLFNLLLLKGQLRRDDCEIPFYLDEIESLDDDNRRAILSEARRLGFIAVTAAPKAVSEVDALYFVQPQNGKIVLRKRHRMGVKRHGIATTK